MRQRRNSPMHTWQKQRRPTMTEIHYAAWRNGERAKLSAHLSAAITVLLPAALWGTSPSGILKNRWIHGKNIPLKMKLCLYTATWLSIMLYNCNSCMTAPKATLDKVDQPEWAQGTLYKDKLQWTKRGGTDCRCRMSRLLQMQKTVCIKSTYKTQNSTLC